MSESKRNVQNGDEIENVRRELINKFEEEKTPQNDKVGYMLIGAFVACIVICAFYVWFNMESIFGVANFSPKTSALEDGYVSSGNSICDGQHLFDVEGYMKRNGFKKEYDVRQDETSATTVAIVFSKKHTVVRLRSLRTYSAETGGTTMVETAIMIRREGDPEGKIYLATYSGDPSDELVYDDDSALFLHKGALKNLDLVLKSGNIDKADSCPFEGLDIMHNIVEDNNLLPHID